MPSDEQEVSPQSIEIKHNDKFFTRIMSKESSIANSSNRVYYGGASGAIPFMWESSPGTPKHALADTCIPPLTPPPSYHSTSKSNCMHKNANPNILTTIFRRLTPKRTRMSPSSSMSSTSSTSSRSSFHSKSKKSYGFSSARSPICCTVDDSDDDDDNGGHGLGSPTSTLCYDAKRKPVNGCHFMGNMKNAVLSRVRQGSLG
ncbi:Structural maintenance of chromosomes protein [Salix suchowensis]|nr:Structural maintenance of chromosomes protein [Salix suchowensis]